MSLKPDDLCELCREEIGDLTDAWLMGKPHNWVLCGVCRRAFWDGRRYLNATSTNGAKS